MRSHASRDQRFWWVLALFFSVPIGTFASPLLAKMAPGGAPPGSAPPGAEEPSFLIEKISVAGTRQISEDLIRSETRLKTDQVYSESELRDAIRRLDRLPFLLDSRLSLRRGSARGRYELLITVEEAGSFFSGGDLVLTELGTPLALDAPEAVEDSLSYDQLAGWRFFVGDHGVAYAAVGTHDVQAGFAHYRPFGRQGLFTFDIGRAACCTVTLHPLGLDPGVGSWSHQEGAYRASVGFGVPLARRQGLSFKASYLESASGQRWSTLDAETPQNEYDDLREVRLEVVWSSDSTDDSVLPNRGLALSAALDARLLNAKLVGESATGEKISSAARAHLVRAVFSVTHHWSLSDRQVASLAARLAFGRSTIDDLPTTRGLISNDFKVVEGSLSLQHSLALWGAKMNRRFGELRWQNTIAYSHDSLSPALVLDGHPFELYRLSSALVFRGSWGVFRLGLSYLELGEPA